MRVKVCRKEGSTSYSILQDPSILQSGWCRPKEMISTGQRDYLVRLPQCSLL
jgi:hypothetical protein